MMQVLRVLRRRLGLSFSAAMHDRFDFTVEFVMQLVVIAINVAFFGIIYSHVTTLNGWTYHETLLVLALYQLSDGLYQLALYPNVRRIPKFVRYGLFDPLLTQPIDIQINLIRQLSTTQFGVLLTGLALLLYAGGQLNLNLFSLFGVTLLFLIIGFLFQWAVVFAANTLGFWLVRNDNLIHVATALLDLAKIPTPAYGKAVNVAFTFLVPLAIIATIPAEVLLGRGILQVVIIASAVVLLLFWLSRKFFFWALKQYSSASG